MYQNAIKTIRTLLPLTTSVSTTDVEDAVDNILKIDRFSGLNKESLIRQIEEIYRIRQDDFKKIERSERRLPWLREKKTNISWGFWNRYREYLEVEKNFSLEVVNNLSLTDSTLF